jgi:predicted PurR-regulated permease PerM
MEAAGAANGTRLKQQIPLVRGELLPVRKRRSRQNSRHRRHTKRSASRHPQGLPTPPQYTKKRDKYKGSAPGRERNHRRERRIVPVTARTLTQTQRTARADPRRSFVNLEAKRQSWDRGGRGPFSVQDSTPLQDTATFWRIVSQVATIAMAVILFGAFLYFARTLLVPVLSALVVSMTLGPLVGRAENIGIPAWVPAVGIVLALVAGCYLAIVLLSDPASELIARSSEIGDAVKQKFQFLDRPMSALRELQTAIFGSNTNVALNVDGANILQSILTTVTPAAVEFLLFYATLFFFLLGRNSFRRYAVRLLSTQDGRLRALKIMNDIEDSLSRYLLTITLINFCLGLVTIAATWIIGLPAPVIWGALAFVLNYIPYIGPGIMNVGLFAIGLLVFPTLVLALIAPAIFITLTFVEGHFITPNVVGRRMYMNALAVFLSLAFWTWLWGAIGAFLATPLLIMATVAMHHVYPRDKAELPE